MASDPLEKKAREFWLAFCPPYDADEFYPDDDEAEQVSKRAISELAALLRSVADQARREEAAANSVQFKTDHELREILRRRGVKPLPLGHPLTGMRR